MIRWLDIRLGRHESDAVALSDDYRQLYSAKKDWAQNILNDARDTRTKGHVKELRNGNPISMAGFQHPMLNAGYILE